ncbi:hypothetical protein LXL04_024369 [Taraxacum kok-saghyz]
MNQIPHLRPTEYKRSRLSRNRRAVNRAYGGVLSARAVRERLDYSSFFGGRAEDCEEQKKVLKIQKTKEKQAGKITGVLLSFDRIQLQRKFWQPNVQQNSITTQFNYNSIQLQQNSITFLSITTNQTGPKSPFWKAQFICLWKLDI